MKLSDRISKIMHDTFYDRKKWITEYGSSFWIKDIVLGRFFMQSVYKHHENVYNYLRKEITPVIKKYKNEDMRGTAQMCTDIEDANRIPVWVCWFQGEANMPRLVKVCYDSMKKMLPDICDIHLLTWDNLNDYVIIPAHIMKLYDDGKITMTHLSDIIRAKLILEHGGFWIDATYYYARSVSEEAFDRPFFTRRRNSVRTEGSVSNGRWSYNYIMGSRGDNLFGFLLDAVLYYWGKHDQLLDPLIMDYFMWIAYDEFEDVKKRIMELPYTDSETTALIDMIDDPYDAKAWGLLLRRNKVFKLTYKKELQEYTIGNQLTYWGYVCSQNAANGMSD